MSDSQTGFPRDAAWWDHPNTRDPKRVHRVGPDGLMSACDSKRIMLDIDGRAMLVTQENRCRRCWPDDASA